MPQAHASIATEKASSYLQQLCKHWSHKFEVKFTPQNGWIKFNDKDQLHLNAEGSLLALQLSTQTPEQLESLKEVVEKHIVRFAFKETLSIVWLPA